MKRPFRKKPEKKEENTSLVDADYNKKKLFKKGINLMADERLDDAARTFELVLRIDPDNVEALLKLGYSKFHLEDYSDALKVYDKILDIDVTNAETWNLKALVHYEQKKYSKALDSVEKAIESEPTFGMAWYNKSCFLSLLSQIPESMEALKRSIEIDVKNARKAIKDFDFLNVRAEEGFKRIEEVVVIESIRQGYHTIGSIVWTTFIDKNKALLAIDKLLEKGLIVKHETRKGFTKVATYDLVLEMAGKVGVEKKRFMGTSKKRLPVALKSLKGLSEAIQAVKSSFEEEDVEKIIENFDTFIDPNKYGQQMIDQFFEEHREIRLWKIRLKDSGLIYLQENKQKMNDLFDNIEAIVTQKIRNEIAQN